MKLEAKKLIIFILLFVGCQKHDAQTPSAPSAADEEKVLVEGDLATVKGTWEFPNRTSKNQYQRFYFDLRAKELQREKIETISDSPKALCRIRETYSISKIGRETDNSQTEKFVIKAQLKTLENISFPDSSAKCDSYVEDQTKKQKDAAVSYGVSVIDSGQISVDSNKYQSVQMNSPEGCSNIEGKYFDPVAGYPQPHILIVEQSGCKSIKVSEKWGDEQTKIIYSFSTHPEEVVSYTFENGKKIDKETEENTFGGGGFTSLKKELHSEFLLPHYYTTNIRFDHFGHLEIALYDDVNASFFTQVPPPELNIPYESPIRNVSTKIRHGYRPLF